MLLVTILYFSTFSTFNSHKPILHYLRTTVTKTSSIDWTPHYIGFRLCGSSFLCLVRIFVGLYFLIFTTFDSFAVGHVRGQVGAAIYWMPFEGAGERGWPHSVQQLPLTHVTGRVNETPPPPGFLVPDPSSRSFVTPLPWQILIKFSRHAARHSLFSLFNCQFVAACVWRLNKLNCLLAGCLINYVQLNWSRN